MTHADPDDDLLAAELAAEQALQTGTSSRRGSIEAAIIAFSALLTSLFQSVLIPLLGVLPQELNTSTSAVQWLLTATLLVSALGMPIMGRLGDLYGKKLMLQVSMLLGVVGSLICALSSDIVWLIVGRAFQGAAMAVTPLAISLLASLLPPERRAGAIAMVGAMLGIGGALGMPLSGIVAERWDFHVLFWITFVIGVIFLIVLTLYVPESPLRSQGRFDLTGSILLSAALVALLLPLAQASTWGWGSPWTIGLLAASVVLIGIFGVHQLNATEPLVDLAAARTKPLLMAHTASTLFGIAIFATFIGTTVFVEMPEETGYGFGASIIVGGLCMLPGGLVMIPAALLGGRGINRIGATQTMSIGAGIMLIGWVWRIFLNGSYAEVIIGNAIIGAGISIGTAALPAIVNHYTPVQEIAAANALNTLVRSVGSSLASAVSGTIMGTMVIHVLGFDFPTLGAFRLMFVLCGTAAAIAMVLGLLMPKVPPSGRPAPARAEVGRP